MQRRELLAAVSGAGLFGVAGCAGDGGDGSDGGDGGDGGGPTDTTETTTPGEEDPDAAVALQGIAFSPRRLSVEEGATVEWANEESVGHDVTADQFSDRAADWSFGVSLAEGETTTYTFESAGVYEYYCTVHGETSMCGAVLVGDASLPEGALPCESDGDGGDGGDGYY